MMALIHGDKNTPRSVIARGTPEDRVNWGMRGGLRVAPSRRREWNPASAELLGGLRSEKLVFVTCYHGSSGCEEIQTGSQPRNKLGKVVLLFSLFCFMLVLTKQASFVRAGVLLHSYILLW